jgi:hypothetical protein
MRPSEVRTSRHAVEDALLPAAVVAAVVVLGVPAPLVLVGVALVLGAALVLGGGG